MDDSRQNVAALDAFVYERPVVLLVEGEPLIEVSPLDLVVELDGEGFLCSDLLRSSAAHEGQSDD